MSDRITNPTSPERSAMMRSVKREGTELEKLGYDVITLWQCQIDDESVVNDKLGRISGVNNILISISE